MLPYKAIYSNIQCIIRYKVCMENVKITNVQTLFSLLCQNGTFEPKKMKPDLISELLINWLPTQLSDCIVSFCRPTTAWSSLWLKSSTKPDSLKREVFTPLCQTSTPLCQWVCLSVLVVFCIDVYVIVWVIFSLDLLECLNNVGWMKTGLCLASLPVCGLHTLSGCRPPGLYAERVRCTVCHVT